MRDSTLPRRYRWLRPGWIPLLLGGGAFLLLVFEAARGELGTRHLFFALIVGLCLGLLEVVLRDNRVLLRRWVDSGYVIESLDRERDVAVTQENQRVQEVSEVAAEVSALHEEMTQVQATAAARIEQLETEVETLRGQLAQATTPRSRRTFRRFQGFQHLASYRQLRILEVLFPDVEDLVITRRLDGGYSNSGVYAVKIRRDHAHGHTSADLILKFGKTRDLRAEVTPETGAYDRYIREALPHAGAQPVHSYLPDRPKGQGAAVYTLSRFRRKGVLRTFGEYYTQHTPDQVLAILERIFDEDHLGRLHDQPRPADLPLYSEYNRLSEHRGRILEAAQMLGDRLKLPWLTRLNVTTPTLEAHLPELAPLDLDNPLYWVTQVFTRFAEEGRTRRAVQGIKHGDLHSGNILVEEAPHTDPLVWFIDFNDTQPGHTLDDFCRLEADIKFHLTPATPTTLAQALDVDARLLAPTMSDDLADPEPPLQLGDDWLKTWRAVLKLRSFAAPVNGQSVHLVEPSLYTYYLSLLHATLPMVYYAQCQDWQRALAFVSAARLCRRLTELDAE